MYKLNPLPKSLGFGLNSGDNIVLTAFDGIDGNAGVFRVLLAAAMVERGRVNDANRLTYLTPHVAGF